jgi:hypothetical protein
MPSDNKALPAVKLPVLRTIEEGLAALRPIWRRVLALLLVILAIEIALDYLLPFIADLLGGLLSAQGAHTVTLILGALVRILLYTNLLLAIARLVLFAESPAVTILFRWGSRQWRFFWTSFVISLVAVVPIIAGAILTPRLGSLLALPEAVLAVQAIYGLCWLWAASWLLLVIPVIAGDDPDPSIDKAWRIAAGNRIRLMGIPACILGGVLIAIGCRLIFEAFFTVDPLQIGLLGDALLILLFEAVYVASAASGAAAYRRLVGVPPQADAV